ncbi:MAG: DNA primase [Bacilli bacterium]
MAYINEEEINTIRSNADIVEIIGDYLELKQKGRNYVAICPFHDDHTPSLVVSKERQIFNCFTCKTGGNVFSFVMKYENVSFPEAIKIVAKKIGYNLKSNYDDVVESKYKKEYEIMNFAAKYYMNNINSKEGLEARKYLDKRGITSEIIKEFNIGLATDKPSDLYNILNKKNYSLDELDKLGLVNKYNLDVFDTFQNRIIIPIEDIKGQIVGFTGRIYHNEKDIAKYINTKETIIFKKGNILFNFHNARNYIREKKQAILVEGNMDAIKLSAKGIKNVIALMGVALSKEQIIILKKLNVPIILMLDNDSAGLNATFKNGELLRKNGIEVLVVRLKDAKDPDEYIETKGVNALIDNINHANNYIDFLLESLKNGLDLNNINDLKKYINSIILSTNNEDDLTKELIISKISKEYQIDEKILKQNIDIKQIKQKEDKKEERKPKISKYQKAVSKILYMMMLDNKYITIYKNRLGYFKEKKEREVASEIIYYNSKNDINIADFLTYILNNEELSEFIDNILGENENTKDSIEEFNNCIEVVLKILKEDEIEKLKVEIKNELDINKKVELMTRLTEIKKEV